MTNALASHYDVIVVGSGAGGLLAAIRAHELGCSVAVVEKAPVYGGNTTYSTGGIWTPMNDSVASIDSPELAMTYLQAVTKGAVAESGLRAFVDNALPVTRYLQALGLQFSAGVGYPDYFSQLPGAIRGRGMLPGDRDGKTLGPHFETMREGHPNSRLLNRYALNPALAVVLGARLPGWRKTLAQLVWRYWSDIGWRLRTKKDRRLTMGRSVIGGLRSVMAERGIPLFLNTPMTGLIKDGAGVAGVRVERDGVSAEIKAKAVILATGGFERSQALRDEFLVVETHANDSACPPDGGNKGDAIAMAREAGAALDFMSNAWWCPTMVLPAGADGKVYSYPVFFDRAKPGSISVNRLGKRFVSEAVSYDLFGYAMVEDQRTTGANTPCWMIFDARYRAKYPAGAVMPSWAIPDGAVPAAWWDKVIFSANDVAALARKIDVPEAALVETISNVNRMAASGVDEEFHRGETEVERAMGDPSVRPNPSFAALDQAPFYAMRMDLGDLGTRGGLRIDAEGAVLNEAHAPIPGLYVVGDVAANIFGDTYPGGGCAIAQAFVFGYLSASKIAKTAASR